MDTLQAEFLAALEKLWWESAEVEVRNMLLSFLSLRLAWRENAEQGNGTLRNALPEPENFKNMYKAWTSSLVDPDDSTLYDDCIARAKRHDEMEEDHRVAKALFMASGVSSIDLLPSNRAQFIKGFLDVDNLYEARPKSRVNVEELPKPENSGVSTKYLRAIACNGCQQFLRTPTYFQCNENCMVFNKDCEHEIAISTQDDTVTWNPKITSDMFAEQLRLCRKCKKNADGIDLPQTCRQEHLQEVTHQNPSGKGVRELQDTIDRKSLQNSLSSAAQKYTTLGKVESAFAPAGDFHLSLMFGPLIFESGVPGKKGGVLISPRPLPSLLRDPGSNNALLYGSTAKERLRTHLLLYEDNQLDPHEFRIEVQKHVTRQSNILCCIKRVYGGAFSGYLELTMESESTILSVLVNEAQRCRFKKGKRQSALRKQLHFSSATLVNMLKGMLERDVKIYLTHVTKILFDPESKFSWHLRRNNCHELTDRLLRGAYFKDFLPCRSALSASQYAENEVEREPRYLISFGDRVEGKYMSSTQPKSFIEKFCADAPKFKDQEEEDQRDDIVAALQKQVLIPSTIGTRNRFQHFSELALCVGRLTSEVLGADHEEYLAQAHEALWDLPRDTLSILQFHLQRSAAKYRTAAGEALDQKQWMQSRARLLHQLSIFASLTGGLGAAVMNLFSKDPDLINRVKVPRAQAFGSLASDERVQRIYIPISGTDVYIIANRNKDRCPHTTWAISNAIWQDYHPRISKLNAKHGGVTKWQKRTAFFKSNLAALWSMLFGKVKLLKPTHFVPRLAGESIAKNPASFMLEQAAVDRRGGWIFLGFRDAMVAIDLHTSTMRPTV